MKTASKFFLIICAVITAIGGIMCLVGYVTANADGIQLYDKKVDGKSVYTVDLNDTDITKISVKATDADITVLTGEENEYIDFVNFNEGYRSVSSTNTVVSFDEYISFSSAFAFWENGFSFKGMRSILDFRNISRGEKEVNIHLSDKRNIKNFTFSIQKGTVTVKDISGDTDYYLAVDNGNVIFENVTTTSKFSLESTAQCNVSLTNCSISNFTADGVSLGFEGELTDVKTFALDAKEGKATAEITPYFEKQSLTLQTTGTITLNGEKIDGAFKNTDDKKTDKKDEKQDKTEITVQGETVSVDLTVNKKPSTEENTEDTR